LAVALELKSVAFTPHHRCREGIEGDLCRRCGDKEVHVDVARPTGLSGTPGESQRATKGVRETPGIESPVECDNLLGE
jgi:hypothetical protein